MIVCVKCKKEMRCTKTGRGVRWDCFHMYPGDEFTCPQCNAKIVACTVGNCQSLRANQEDIYMDQYTYEDAVHRLEVKKMMEKTATARGLINLRDDD